MFSNYPSLDEEKVRSLAEAGQYSDLIIYIEDLLSEHRYEARAEGRAEQAQFEADYPR